MSKPMLTVYGVHDGPLDQSWWARFLRWLFDRDCDDVCCAEEDE